jgi:hypothetical protein
MVFSPSAPSLDDDTQREADDDYPVYINKRQHHEENSHQLVNSQKRK